MTERRLGRGLEFLLSDAATPQAAESGVVAVDVKALGPSPHQPRKEFSATELDELAQSIRATGILQPILVRKRGDKLEIIAGERRWRAAKLAGMERIPALIREISDEQAAVFGLVENIQRTDLNAIEKASAMRRIQRMTKASQEEVARQVGLDRSTVANLLRLLDLPEDVQAHVSRGTLTMGHARALLGLASADEQRTVADAIVRQRLSVRKVEELVKQLQSVDAPGKTSTSAPRERPVWVNEIEETLIESLRTSVRVRYGRKRSTIAIECLGREEFERVYELLKNLAAPSDEAR